MKKLDQISRKDKNNLITKKDGTLKKRIQDAVDFCWLDNKMYLNVWQNKGRHLMSYQWEICNLLTMAGYKVTRGNDAPRGGREGEFIKVSNAALEFLKSLKTIK